MSVAQSEERTRHLCKFAPLQIQFPNNNGPYRTVAWTAGWNPLLWM